MIIITIMVRVELEKRDEKTFIGLSHARRKSKRGTRVTDASENALGEREATTSAAFSLSSFPFVLQLHIKGR